MAIKLTDLLTESKKTYSKFSSDDREDLAQFIHDKRDYADNDGLETAFKYYSEYAPIIYRGAYELEHKKLKKLKIGETFKSKSYLSFSEKLSVAKEFADWDTILSLKNAKGFNYWKYVVTNLKDLKEEDPEEFDSVDGDFLIKSAKEEKEWLIPVNTKFKIIDRKKIVTFILIEIEQI